MKTSCLIVMLSLFILGVYKVVSQMNWESRVALTTSVRRNQWIRNEKLSPLPYEVHLNQETRFCHRESERIIELILLKSGRFTYKLLDNKGKKDLRSRSFEGYFSVDKGEIYYAEEHQFYAGSVLMLNSDLTPKIISFGRVLFNLDDCKNFAL